VVECGSSEVGIVLEDLEYLTLQIHEKTPLKMTFRG
jgi:hypothetical protein